MKRFVLLAFILLGAVTPLSAQEEVFPLSGLVVTASPTPRPVEAMSAHVTVLKGDDLRARGVATVLDALRGVSGATVVQGGSFGATTSLFLRGGESDYTLVLVDGVQVNQPGGAFDFAGLTLDNVERIEIVRGPASALYGSDAVSGVIHVITRAGGGRPTGTVSTRLGTYGQFDWSADVSAGAERAGYTLSIARTETDGILDFNNRHVRTVVSGSARLRPDERTDLSLSVRLGDRAYHFPTDGSGGAEDRNAFTFGDETLVHLGATRRVSGALDLEARLGLNEMDGGTDDAADGPADTLGFFGFNSLDHTRRSTATLMAHSRLRGAVFTGGFEMETERQRSFTESLSQFGSSNGRSLHDRSNRAFYGHVAGQSGGVSYNGGARLEDNERYGRIATWQVGGSWLAAAALGTRVRASLGRAIKEPTFFETFATGFAIGNLDLRPERSVSWEVGLDQEVLTGRGRLQATYFDQEFRDLIQYTFVPTTPGGPNYENVAAAEARGVELDAEVRVGSAVLGGSWTWLHTEVVDAGFDVGPGAGFVEGKALLRRPARSGGVRLSVPLGAALSTDASARFVGVRADRDFATFPATAVDLPGYILVAAGLSWKLRGAEGGRPGVAVQARAENLLDRDHQEVLGFRSPGRAFYMGATISFGGAR